MAAGKHAYYARSCNTQTSSEASDSNFSYVFRTALTTVEPLELGYWFRFPDAKSKAFRTDLKDFNYLSVANSVTFEWLFLTAKTLLRCPASLIFVHNEAFDVFEDPHYDDRSLVTSGTPDMVLLHCVTKQCLTSLSRLKGQFLKRAFYKVSALFVSAIQALF